MNPVSSSTSASERAGKLGKLFAMVGSACLCLALLDLAVGRLYPLPSEAQTPQSSLAAYFGYGRSIEGKLRAMVKEDDAHSAWIAPEGWLATPLRTPQPTEASAPDRTLVAVYGQSFSTNVAKAAARLDPHFELRYLQAPSAPLSHSYAVYQGDRPRHQAQVVAIGVLASTLVELTTITGATLGFWYPYPYTYPRYRLVDGRLQTYTPSITSLAQLRATLADPARFAAFRAELAAEDEAYDPWLFDQDVLDHSVLGRLFRRALAQRHRQDFTARFHDEGGFRNHHQLLDVAEALLVSFATSARADGRVPYVLLLDDGGYANGLFAALGPRLSRADIPFVSGHLDAPAADPRSFQPDGHFRPELDERIAQRWLRDLRARGLLQGQPHAASVSP
jgi:hypothetical protein